MLSKLSSLGEIMQVYARLRIGKLGVIGAFAVFIGFTGLCSFLLADWLWYQCQGRVILQGHEVFGEKPDLSFLLPLPLVWVTFHVVKGRVFLSADEAAKRQEKWDDVQWAVWNMKGRHGLSSLGFVLSLFGIVTLLALLSLCVIAVQSL